MKISVVIPTYNSTATIEATVSSVLSQSVTPHEILVVDDGSTDNTLGVLESYRSHIMVIRQTNRGVAHARNVLCRRAQGDLIAFLDHDDQWHPKYLEMQSNLYLKYPNAVAFFTGHVNFHGYENYSWDHSNIDTEQDSELITPLNFFKQYNTATGLFASMSYCCIPKRILNEIGDEPFHGELSGVDDSYLCYLLPLVGPVVYTSIPLVAYRITSNAQSANRLRSFGLWVHAFELLEKRYENLIDVNLLKAFKMAFASKRRQYSKILMSAGNYSEARKQIRTSMRNSMNLISLTKSAGLLFLTHLPEKLQPRWTGSQRVQNKV